MRELKSVANGKNGSRTFTLTEIGKEISGKKTHKQIGKLKIQKCTLTWHDGYETKNNKFQVSWDEFVVYMKKHPAE